MDISTVISSPLVTSRTRIQMPSDSIRLERSKLIDGIEKYTMQIMKEIMNGESPSIVIKNVRNWKNSFFSDCITLNPSATTISISFVKNKEKFTRIMHMLNKVYQLLISESNCNLRKLFYDDVEIYDSQRQSNEALKVVCSMLDCMPVDLGVLATSKGLIAGPVNLTTRHAHIIDCSKPSGAQVPTNVYDIIQVESQAKFILMVEKETSFRKLLDEDIFGKLEPCILITGKGFPDISTRLMLRMMSDKLKIPVLGLVDCDPHGIEIMLVYRFGSLSQSQYGKALAVPSMRWIGVQPRDVLNFKIPSVPLSSEDKKKLGFLCERQYLKSNPQLMSEITKMIEVGCKAEIESLYHFSPSYLTDVFLPNKMLSKELF